MKHSFKTGLGFGVTSGIITTLGLVVGLHAGTYSRLAILGGILTIAISDSFSDSLGIHIAKEFEDRASTRDVWESTIITFTAKFLMALIFAIPVFLFSLDFAIKFDIALGFFLLGLFSYYVAKMKQVKPFPVICEHIFIAIVVIFITQFTGDWVRQLFMI
ncbi:hypothetical protein GF322_03125 [Candidatus Dependentiae bacterium]|nr:hypothetical protein [Candidatus Dependentiae bacterium]